MTDTQREKDPQVSLGANVASWLSSPVLPCLSEEKHCYCATVENSFLKDIPAD